MAQYKIMYRRGHTGTIYSYGARKYNESYLSLKEQELCPGCKIDLKNKKAAEISESMELPQLIGKFIIKVHMEKKKSGSMIQMVI